MMKRCFLQIYMVLLVAMTLVGCGGKEPRRESLSLNGAWMLTHRRTPIGSETDYPYEGKTWLRIYECDSAIYECAVMESPNGMMITPSQTEVATLIDKGDGEYLYYESDGPHPLTVVDDSTITIQHTGILYTWVRDHSVPARRLEEIKRIVASECVDYASERSNYVFSELEDDLKEENSTLVVIIAAVLVGLIAVGAFARDAVRQRKQVERQLRQLEAERANRPQVVVDALKSVENEFFGSEYYMTLCKQIERKKLKKGDWEEMARRLDGVYPGFTSKLLGLYKMSDVEYRVCLLLKLRVPLSGIAETLCRETSSISSIRSRLFLKIFGRKGSAKDFDEFIFSL